MMGVYQSQEDIDTDDGSSYYQTHNNYFAMAGRGLKSDFAGQWCVEYVAVLESALLSFSYV
jgi:hypothetical protein